MRRIEDILRKEIGLDAVSIGSSVIERTLRLRMKEHGLKHAEDYDQLLSTSPEELSALVEAIVVTETWFMRGREAFAAFADLALNEWLPRNPTAVMRVLSLPCSSGEEPFSLAMTLLDAGVPGDRFAIDAVDISANAIARAGNAIYGKNSFRGKHLEFRDRYFVPVVHSISPPSRVSSPKSNSDKLRAGVQRPPTLGVGLEALNSGGEGGRETLMEDGYALSPDIQRHVTFYRDNLLREGFCVGVAHYDFIFCRNLLIYFDRATQFIALEKMRAMLAPDGVLFVGPAEIPIAIESGFTSTNISLAFASRKSEIRNQKSKVQSPPTLDFRLETLGSVVSPLVIARQLADAGQLAEAEILCREHLLADDTCAEGYYLMGLVKDAANDSEAINFYRKAIYLDPNHHEALIHVALLLEKNGDAGRADAFKRRAERVQSNPRTKS